MNATLTLFRGVRRKLSQGNLAPRQDLSPATLEQLDWLEALLDVPEPPRTAHAQFNANGLSWLKQLPTLDQVIAEKCLRSLAEFVRRAWAVLEPATPLVWNWHLDVLCDHLQIIFLEWKAARAEQRAHTWANLIINVPPGTMKSRVVSVCFPAWAWLICPDWRSTYVSGNPRVALRDSVFCRQLIESDWYMKTFAPAWRLSANHGKLHRIKDWALAKDQNAKSLFSNTRGGSRMAIGARAKITGSRSDFLGVDDPQDANDGETDRNAVNEWWDTAANSRVNDLRLSVRVIIQQRVHENDLTGHVLAKAPAQWRQLALPAEYDPELAVQCTKVLGFIDPRTQPGELLFEGRLSKEVLDAERVKLGEAAYQAQYNQRPAPAGGIIFNPKWWRFWRYSWEPDVPELVDRTIVIPDKFDDEAISVDCSFKGKEGNDLVAAGRWKRSGARSFLMPDLVWRNLSFLETLVALKEMRANAPDVNAMFVEDAANGPAVVEVLELEIPGTIIIKPQGEKTARGMSISPQVEAGQVFLPLHAPWRDKYIDEHTKFPKGAHDDAVDQQSQMLLRWKTAVPPKKLRFSFA